MAGSMVTSLISLATNLLPSITASAHGPSSSLNYNNSERERARAVEEDLERLMRTLKLIKATLYDAEEREIRDLSVKLWLKELKKVAYEAEDVLSGYRYEVTRVQIEARNASQALGSHKGKQMESIEYIVPIPDDMVDRLNKIRSRFDEIAKDRAALQLRESDGVRRPNNKILRPPTGHMVDEASIFGRDDEKKEVINFLLPEKGKKKEPFSVISIVGKGGLGKTTIAQLVYKDQRISQFFDSFGWVCVSEEFDVRRLIKATIESISKFICNVRELSPLQEELAKIVKGKKVLVVLDDVWNENENLWELFRVPFREAKMAQILVTTRNNKVAEVMQTTACCRPTNLPENLCWELFKHYAFSCTSYTVPTELVDMGREIMRKCGGLPLTVKSIASLLRHETDVESWREILESDLWESNPSIEIFSALQISYAHLPAHLKPCFLFCPMYPKDYILEKMNLIELWICHGYIKPRGKKRIIEIGVEYYEELKGRSFLDDFSDQYLECCKLHDIIHDLARLNSENEYYSVEISQPLDIQKENVLHEAYHLHLGGFIGYVNQVLPQNLKGLRTLSTDLSYEDFHYSILTEFLTKFEALRVLELKGLVWRKIPDTISQVKHLVYLCITNMHLTMMPSSIGLLYNLQTLILDCPYLKCIPESIGDLANLRRLVIRSYVSEDYSNKIRALPNTIGCLSSLEEFDLGSRICISGKEMPPPVSDNAMFYFVPHGLVNFPTIKTMRARLIVSTIAWLKDMKDLEGKLTIEGLINTSNFVDAQQANLRNKCRLETLDLCWYPGMYTLPNIGKSELILNLRKGSQGGLVGAKNLYFSLLECLQPHSNLRNLRVKNYHSATIPEWMTDPFSLQSIREVSLEYCDNIESLPFRNLHTLKHLNLKKCSSIRVLQLSSQLEKLQISNCNHLEFITGLEGLHKLEKLQISHCNHLKFITGLGALGKLEKLQISNCNHLEYITGLGGLDMLVELEISRCEALKSLTMDELHLVESTEPFDHSSHEIPHIGCQRFSSLKRLVIEYCVLLRNLPDELISSRPSYVCVSSCSCPDLSIGCP